MVKQKVSRMRGSGRFLVNADSLSVTYAKIKIHRTAAPGTPVTLRVELVGGISYGRVVTQHPRRTFGQWLLRRPASRPSLTD